MKSLKKCNILDEQIDIVEAKLTKVPFGSEEYFQLLELREHLVEQRNKEKKRIPWKDIADISLRVAEIGGNLLVIGAGYTLYAQIAKMSYGLDQDMTLCDGKVSNLKENIIRLLPKKV